MRRYFRPGVNWAGRALYGVPVFGFALVAASDGAFDAGDAFVAVGLVLWLVAAVLAEVVVWPGRAPDPGRGHGAVGRGGARGGDGPGPRS